MLARAPAKKGHDFKPKFIRRLEGVARDVENDVLPSRVKDLLDDSPVYRHGRQLQRKNRMRDDYRRRLSSLLLSIVRQASVISLCLNHRDDAIVGMRLCRYDNSRRPSLASMAPHVADVEGVTRPRPIGDRCAERIMRTLRDLEWMTSEKRAQLDQEHFQKFGVKRYLGVNAIRQLTPAFLDAFGLKAEWEHFSALAYARKQELAKAIASDQAAQDRRAQLRVVGGTESADLVGLSDEDRQLLDEAERPSR